MKKFLSIILAVISIFSCFSIIAGAEDNHISIRGEYDNIKWSLYKNGSLVFDGTGKISAAQYYCDSKGEVKNIVVNDGIKEISSGVFEGYYNVESVKVSNSIVIMGYAAFNGCSSIREMELPFTGSTIEENKKARYNHLGYIFGAKKYTGSVGVCVDLSGYNYEHCYYYMPEALTKVTITGENVFKSAFAECNLLTDIILSQNVHSIGDNAFAGCASVKNIFIPNSIEEIGNYAFSRCESIKDIYIPDSVKVIPEGVFYQCSSLTSIKIHKNIEEISVSAFYGCNNISSIIVDQDNPIFDSRSESNAIIESDTNTLIMGCKNTIIPNGIKSIGSCAFRGCIGLEEIKIPNSVCEIGDMAFANCSSLTSILIPEGISVVQRSTFFGCISLSSICLPSTVGEIEAGAFCNCESLTSINIPGGVCRITYMMFYGCTSLTTISIPQGVQVIECEAFRNCSSLLYVDLPDGLTSIWNDAFAGCSSLKTISIPDSVEGISSGLFYGCKSLQTASIPSKITAIPNDIFYGCINLKSVTISSSNISQIGENSFFDCYSLEALCFDADESKYSRITIEDGNLYFKSATKMFKHCHNYRLSVHTPTCTTYGCSKHTCMECNYYYELDYESPTGIHAYELTSTTPSTYYNTGKHIYTCKDCNKVKEETIDMLSCFIGDVDNDNAITVADARLSLRAAIKLDSHEQTSREYRACDYDGDNNITVNDARKCLRMAINVE